MKGFLFRVSRVMSVFLIAIYILFCLSEVDKFADLGAFLFFSPILVIQMIMNWFIFGKFSLWISKEVLE